MFIDGDKSSATLFKSLFVAITLQKRFLNPLNVSTAFFRQNFEFLFDSVAPELLNVVQPLPHSQI